MAPLGWRWRGIKELPQHLIVTRHGIGVRRPSWYETRPGLLQAVTLPSIACQARPGLFWLIVIDADIPQTSLDALNKAVCAFSFIHLVRVDPAAFSGMVQGGFSWIWNACRDYVLTQGIVEDVSKFVITSIIDDDDAWRGSVVRRVDAHVVSKSDELQRQSTDYRRGYLVRHTTGLLMTFRHGLIFDQDLRRLQPIEYLAHSMISELMSIASSTYLPVRSRR